MTQPAATNWTDSANDLARLLQQENAALLASDFVAAAALLAAKRGAIERLEGLTPSGPKQILRETVTRLDRLSAENRRLLARSIGIQSKVLGVIAEAARTAGSFGYGRGGRTATRGGAFTLSAKA